MRHVLSSGLRFWIVISAAVFIVVGGGGSVYAQAGGGGRLVAGGNQPAANAKPEPTEAQIQSGRDLFLKRWKQADFATPTGDGLGPVFNGRSCAECHGMIGPGGAGTNEHNVDLLSVTPPNQKNLDRKMFAERMTAIHPAFTADFGSVRPNVTLHKFGTDPAYGEWRHGLLGLVSNDKEPDANLRSLVKRQIAAYEGAGKHYSTEKAMLKWDRQVDLTITQRSTPALFGSGLIDEIRDEVLQETAKAQANRRDTVKGKVAAARGGSPGKFGWRGQTATLQEFVMGACANELGLEVPGHSQGINPMDPAYRARGLDLTQSQCADLTAFVASLPRPTQRQPKNIDELRLWNAGEQVFNSIGCATCHMRTLDSVDGLYSDLLLHDLGPKLADPAGANPTSGPGAATTAYYGGPPTCSCKCLRSHAASGARRRFGAWPIRPHICTTAEPSRSKRQSRPTAARHCRRPSGLPPCQS
jgi:CxxC motif-containing protein (DUF1111 family)